KHLSFDHYTGMIDMVIIVIIDNQVVKAIARKKEYETIMKKYCCFFLFILMITAPVNGDNKRIKTILIFPFENRGGFALAHYRDIIFNYIYSSLKEYPSYSPIPWNVLKEYLEKNAYTMEDMKDVDTIIRISKNFDADNSIHGYYRETNNIFTLNVKVMDDKKKKIIYRNEKSVKDGIYVPDILEYIMTEFRFITGPYNRTTSILSKDNKIITFGIFEIFASAYTAVFDSDGFKTAFPGITVKLQVSQFVDHHNRVSANIRNARGGNDIEVVGIEYLGSFISSGGLTDLSQPPYNGIQAGKDLAQIPLAQGLTENGKLIAMPVDVAPAVLFYRHRIANACGVDLENITDWADYIDKAKVLTSDTDFDGTIDRYALSNFLDLAILLVREGNGSLFGESGNPYEPESKFKTILELARNVSDAGIDGKVNVYSDQGINVLRDGKIVTHFSGAWMEWYLKGRCPELTGDWRVAYPPGHVCANSGGTYLVIPGHVPGGRKRDAWNIIKYLCTDPDAQLIILKAIGAFPVLTTVYNDPVIFEPDEYFGGQKVRELYRTIARQIPEQKMTKWDLMCMNKFNQAMASVIAGTKTVDQAYDDAKSGMLMQMHEER
ncbi:MAG: extracellular solute-binding protein, partial [Spirochaetales bacterium]|nr:extracellular solute-binding protein [Spirochaetales bacterium]